MDNLATYRTYVRQILSRHAAIKSSDANIRREVIFDSEHDRYQLLLIGWTGHKRFHGSLIHMDIIHGKIWVQYDGTEYGVANELVDLGVLKQDIVLAFHAPYKRKFTGFGVGHHDAAEAA